MNYHITFTEENILVVLKEMKVCSSFQELIRLAETSLEHFDREEKIIDFAEKIIKEKKLLEEEHEDGKYKEDF